LGSAVERLDPSAAAGLTDALPARCVHVKDVPRRRRLRPSTLLARSLGEARRRTEGVGRFPGETSCLRLYRAGLNLFLPGARGLGLSEVASPQVVHLQIARAPTDRPVGEVA
jgi:hypothetical protein